ncbi:uncharacterized protein TNCV_2228401 [Trichonephila clavipes]|nr:uncharacterized protein TNCV_2228401 [Trichonephila clavipes]
MARRKGLNLDEIVNLLREISEKESDGDELSCSNLDSDEEIRLSESDCEESEESADIIDNIPVNSDIYIARDHTEWKPPNSNVRNRFTTRYVLQQSSGSTSFVKHNVNVSFFRYKGSWNVLIS